MNSLNTFEKKKQYSVYKVNINQMRLEHNSSTTETIKISALPSQEWITF